VRNWRGCHQSAPHHQKRRQTLPRPWQSDCTLDATWRWQIASSASTTSSAATNRTSCNLVTVHATLVNKKIERRKQACLFKTLATFNHCLTNFTIVNILW
jgi:hypothetical protein